MKTICEYSLLQKAHVSFIYEAEPITKGGDTSLHIVSTVQSRPKTKKETLLHVHVAKVQLKR